MGGIQSERSMTLNAHLPAAGELASREAKDALFLPAPSQNVGEARWLQPVIPPVLVDKRASASPPATGVQNRSESTSNDLANPPGQPEKASDFAQGEMLNSDGIRQYRLSLGREARLYRQHLPRLARVGVVVVVVSTVKGLAIPQVSLSQSSDQEVLDAEALEIIRQSVRAAILPESLYGKEFALTVPMRFSLED